MFFKDYDAYPAQTPYIVNASGYTMLCKEFCHFLVNSDNFLPSDTGRKGKDLEIMET